MAWGGDTHGGGGTLLVPSGLAACLGLPAGAAVAAEVAAGLPPADVVAVEPASSSDWEVLQLNAGLLEEQILSQACLFCEHHLPLLGPPPCLSSKTTQHGSIICFCTCCEVVCSLTYPQALDC